MNATSKRTAWIEQARDNGVFGLANPGGIWRITEIIATAREDDAIVREAEYIKARAPKERLEKLFDVLHTPQGQLAFSKYIVSVTARVFGCGRINGTGEDVVEDYSTFNAIAMTSHIVTLAYLIAIDDTIVTVGAYW